MNAIILAAGKSNRFAPFTYERPKGLFRVKGEILIERQIEQLIAANVTEIYIVAVKLRRNLTKTCILTRSKATSGQRMEALLESGENRHSEPD